jgi:hypothetical protein
MMKLTAIVELHVIDAETKEGVSVSRDDVLMLIEDSLIALDPTEFTIDGKERSVKFANVEAS